MKKAVLTGDWWYQFDVERQVSPEKSFARWTSNLKLCQWTTKTYLGSGKTFTMERLHENSSRFFCLNNGLLTHFFPMHPFSFCIGKKFF